jgi:hypothetical protein
MKDRTFLMAQTLLFLSATITLIILAIYEPEPIWWVVSGLVYIVVDGISKDIHEGNFKTSK